MGYLVFSSESQAPAGYFFDKYTYPIREEFNSRFSKERYSSLLDSISIIPMCFTDEYYTIYDRKERKYVSKKHRYADVRLKLDFLEFVQGDDVKKLLLIYNLIESAANYISLKISDFKKDVFLDDIKMIMDFVYPT